MLQGFCCLIRRKAFASGKGMRNQKTIWIVVLAVVSLSANNLFAQATASATLQGTVMDKSGAVIPNADVKITNKATGLVRGDTTGNTGNYRFELLPPGTYQVRISVKGFATGVYDGRRPDYNNRRVAVAQPAR
ncbi:MAG: hypothetical protein DMG59_14745 [Acidobacteria bacterium]|nr:MAG: hypothetical protein DMG59_14745 [Acidobacteriota bacterium]